MIPIAGRPILEHNVRLLAKHGFREFVVNLHHCPEAVKSYFRDGQAWRVSITYSYEPVLLGTAGAVKNVEDLFDSTFLVVYGDNLTTCDVERLCSFHQQKGGIGTVALFHREDPLNSGIAELDENDRIRRFVEKPKPDQVFSHWVSAGLLVLEPAVLDFIPDKGASDFGRDVFPAILSGGQLLYGYRLSANEGLWWIDTLEDLQRVREDGRWKGENGSRKMEDGRGKMERG